jgi:transcriptional regulator with XRE-family HTH domain
MKDFTQTLKTWRKQRRLSQLDLAGLAEVSARHLSFLETGRARPSRAMVDRLGRALDLPLTARNLMLTQAGFATRHPNRALTDTAMQPVRQAITHMLTRHAPYPAIAIDRLWTVIQMNPPAKMLFSPLGIGEGDSLLDLMRSDALPRVIENWPEVAASVAQRLRVESAALGGVAEFAPVIDHLAKVGGQVASFGPVLPTIYRLGAHRLSLFATIAQFGTPDDLTLDDLKIELYFPNDDETDRALRDLAQSAQDIGA